MKVFFIIYSVGNELWSDFQNVCFEKKQRKIINKNIFKKKNQTLPIFKKY